MYQHIILGIIIDFQYNKFPIMGKLLCWKICEILKFFCYYGSGTREMVVTILTGIVQVLEPKIIAEIK